MSKYNKNFADTMNEVIENIARTFGLDGAVGFIRRVIFGAKPVSAIEIQQTLDKVSAGNKSLVNKLFTKLSDKINNLRGIGLSLATKDVIIKNLQKAKDDYNRVNQQVNLAEAYEKSANDLNQQLSYMSENQRASDYANKMKDDIVDKSNKASDIYQNLANNYELNNNEIQRFNNDIKENNNEI